MLRHIIRQAPRGLAFFTAALLLAWPHPALAGSFAVKPVRVDLSASHKVKSIEVSNTGDRTTSIQLSVVAWRQEEGADIYDATRAVLATPPIFTLEPGEKQVVRVGLRQLPEHSQEAPYRLFLTEIPDPGRSGGPGLEMTLRVGIPVFVQPQGGTEPRLEWLARRLDDGKLMLEAHNRGSAHARLAGASLIVEKGGSIAGAVDGYVLPGSRRRWEVRPDFQVAAGDTLALRAQVNGKTLSARVTVE